MLNTVANQQVQRMPLENQNIRELVNIFRSDEDWKFLIYDALNLRKKTLSDVLRKVGATQQHFSITLHTPGINGYKLISKMFKALDFELIIWVQIKAKRGPGRGISHRTVQVKPRANVKSERKTEGHDH